MKSFFIDLYKNKRLIILIIIGMVVSFCSNLNQSYRKSENVLSYWIYNDSFDGYVFDDFKVGLEKGSYDLKIFFDPTSITEDIEYSVVDFLDVEDGVKNAKVIAEGSIKQGEDSTFINFNVEEPSNNIGIVFEKQFTFYKYLLQSNSTNYCDAIVSTLVFLIIVVISYYFYLKKNYGALIAIGLAIVFTLPFITGYLNKAHDYNFHLARLLGIAKNIREGYIFSNINMAFSGGIGLATGLFYPDLFLYIPALMSVFGCTLGFSFKAFMLLINICTGLLGVFSFQGLFGKKIGSFLSLLWIINPYRLNCLFIRGAVGEIVALFFLPLFIYGLVQVIYKDKSKWYYLVIATFGIINSHIISVLLCLILAILIFILSLPYLIKHQFKERFFALVKSGLFILAITAFFVIPFIDRNIISEIKISDNSMFGNSPATLSQIFMINTEYATGSGIGTYKEMPFSIGPIYLIIIFLFVYTYFYKDKLYAEDSSYIVMFGVSILFLWMSSELFPWQIFAEYFTILYDVFASIQYAWRMLGPSSCLLLFVFGYSLSNISFDFKPYALIMIAVALIHGWSYMDVYTNEMELLLDSNKMINVKNHNTDYYNRAYDEIIFNDYHNYQNKVTANKEIEINSFNRKGPNYYFNLSSPKDTTLTIPLYDYGLYHVYIDDKEIANETNDINWIKFTIDDALVNANIRVVYENRIIYKIGYLISIIGMVSFIFVCCYQNKKKVENY